MPKAVNKQSDRLWLTQTNTQGFKMTVIAYRKANDLDVQFEDGIIVSNRHWTQFIQGEIRHPSFPKSYAKQRQKINDALIGKQYRLNSGESVTLVSYNSSYDVTIQFQDGVIAEHISYAALRKGSVNHPDDSWVGHRKCRKDEVNLSNCGIPMKILEYNTSDDVTIQFDTGYTRHTRYREFHRGKVGHPFPYQIGNITMRSPAYIYNNEGNFYCHCTKCGLEDIMTIQEIKEHKCIE